jgi:hypothetical protein
VDYDNLSIGSSIFEETGTCVGTLITHDEFAIEAGQALTLRLGISGLALAPGSYYAAFSIGQGGRHGNRRDLDIVTGRPAFRVLPAADADDLVAYWSPKWGNVVIGDARLQIAGEDQRSQTHPCTSRP